MRIAPISNYYVNYNKVNSQYRPPSNTPKSYNEPVFTGEKEDLNKLENMKLERVYRQVNRWDWGSSDGTDKIKATYRKYPKETMALANLEIDGQKYELDADFITVAAPLWARGHSYLIKRYLNNHGYNECKYDAKNLKPFIETYWQDSETGGAMEIYAQELNEDGTPRFSPTGVIALAKNRKEYPEIDDFVELQEDDGTYFLSSGERIVELAKLYRSSPDNSARLLKLRNYDGKIVFNEKLLETYNNYPKAFEKFLKATKTNARLERFNNLYFYDVLVPAYAKYPKIMEEYAPVRDYNAGGRYKFNEAEVARLTIATGDFLKKNHRKK